ncbi:hypothetical protein LPMP_341830 [Leishmania panamensis]|uniref:U3 small nucleolar RNA-associated protein 6 N-terminal domain-containing protein n=1 Tax=Leishmania panamensis TaxID=5679 RepID=A0A088S0N0_LEIPA|nr:hypothetical protein LPMP_341830 [Leishmania panamensis]AIO01809.1 hypothetical protein LPMP_341830 [Leishmania panamensis]
MARARAIETRLEKLVPALDEYYTSGFLTREETVEVSRQRQHWEFRLVAKPLLLLDVREAITYELGLEKRLREYCIYTKLNLQHRWDIVDRIEGIYKIGLKHLRNKAEHEALRQECVQFMKQFQRNGSLSNLYGELMVMHPRRSDIWVEAAEWQGFSQRNTDNARAIIQQALLTMASEPVVWACALHVELQFVQRLLEGLLAEHREEARKACRRASKEAENGDEESRAGDAKAPAEAEPTSTIAPKLRAENEAMAHALLDLALAKTVVEEAFDSPASGAVLLERLLAVAGTYAFSREVVELAVTTAAHKMAEACSGSADVTVEAARICGSRGASASSSLTIASDQQRLRVRTQWRHRHSVDTVFAHYLALEDLVMNQYPQTIVDTATYLAEGGSGVGATAKRRGQQRPHQPSATSASLLTPSQKDRRHAAVKAVVSLLTFSSSPTSVLADMPGVVEAGTDSTKRFPAVRQAFVGALRHLAAVSTEGVSRVCARLLRTPTATAASTAAAATASHRSKEEEAPQPRATLDLAEAAQWLLGELQLDKATLQACVTEPRKRTERLLRKVALAADMHPPAKSRARHEAPAGTAAAAALMTWSVVQLERFLQADDRDVLVQSAGGDARDSTKIPPCSPLNTAAAMTAEDVERFIVWWKEEEKLLRGRQETGDPGDALTASRARRRMAVMELLHQHDLLPSVDLPTAAVETKKGRSNRKKTPNRGSSDATSEGAWAKTQGVLLNRSSALQFVPAVGTASPARLPLSLWRVFSALETLEGPMQISEKASWTHAAVSRSGSNSSDDDRDSGTGGSGVAARGRHAEISSSSTWLTSFAAAGLFFLGGVPYSTLSHEEEWVRLEGVTSLLQCRLFSWLGCRVCTRDTVAKALRLAESGLAEAWITDLHGLLKLAQRCQPLPRFAQTRCVLPFLEGVALFRSASASAAALSGQASNLPLPAKAASDAVRAVREAYEVLLKLYGVSKHPESFLPLLYDGTSANKLAQQASTTSSVSGKASTAEVQQANAEDWVAYVWFERTISKDLLRAKTVVEQARREALAPQIFMVRLNAL